MPHHTLPPPSLRPCPCPRRRPQAVLPALARHAFGCRLAQSLLQTCGDSAKLYAMTHQLLKVGGGQPSPPLSTHMPVFEHA